MCVSVHTCGAHPRPTGAAATRMSSCLIQRRSLPPRQATDARHGERDLCWQQQMRVSTIDARRRLPFVSTRALRSVFEMPSPPKFTSTLFHRLYPDILAMLRVVPESHDVLLSLRSLHTRARCNGAGRLGCLRALPSPPVPPLPRPALTLLLQLLRRRPFLRRGALIPRGAPALRTDHRLSAPLGRACCRPGVAGRGGSGPVRPALPTTGGTSLPRPRVGAIQARPVILGIRQPGGVPRLQHRPGQRAAGWGGRGARTLWLAQTRSQVWRHCRPPRQTGAAPPPLPGPGPPRRQHPAPVACRRPAAWRKRQLAPGTVSICESTQRIHPVRSRQQAVCPWRHKPTRMQPTLTQPALHPLTSRLSAPGAMNRANSP